MHIQNWNLKFFEVVNYFYIIFINTKKLIIKIKIFK